MNAFWQGFEKTAEEEKDAFIGRMIGRGAGALVGGAQRAGQMAAGATRQVAQTAGNVAGKTVGAVRSGGQRVVKGTQQAVTNVRRQAQTGFHTGKRQALGLDKAQYRGKRQLAAKAQSAKVQKVQEAAKAKAQAKAQAQAAKAQKAQEATKAKQVKKAPVEKPPVQDTTRKAPRRMMRNVALRTGVPLAAGVGIGAGVASAAGSSQPQPGAYR